MNEADLEQAAKSMTAYFERERAKMVTPAKLQGESSSFVSCKEFESSVEFLELARGIEPPTCGLQIATEPFSDPSAPSPEPTESPMEWPG